MWTGFGFRLWGMPLLKVGPLTVDCGVGTRRISKGRWKGY